MTIVGNSGAAIIGMLRTALIVKSLAIILFTYGVSGLRLTKINVPSKAIAGNSIWLNCSYDLEEDQLYSIKWFKDQSEFYRFLPSATPPKSRYDVIGLNLNLPKSNFGNILVELLDRNAAGDYRCEVSAEAPWFKTLRSESLTLQVYSTAAEARNVSWRPKMSAATAILLIIVLTAWSNFV